MSLSIFDNVQTVIINNKEVTSIKIGSDIVYTANNVQPSSYSLSLTSTNDKLSYANNDSTVLTATVLDEGNNPVSNASVIIKKGQSFMAINPTDSNGQVTYSYTSQGSGDVTFTAECNGITDSCVIEDCLETIASAQPNGFNSQWIPLTSSEVQITFNMVKNGTWGGGRLYWSANGNTQDAVYILLSQNNGNTSENEKIRYEINSTQKAIKIIFGNGSLSLFVNDSLYSTVSIDSTGYVRLGGGSNANPITITNIVIKKI